MNNTPKHGTYEAGLGFYDSSIGGWVKDAAKLTETMPARREVTESDRAQVASWGHRDDFKPTDQLERLLRLRDSDRQEERENYQKLVAGPMRMQMARYEEKRQAAIEAGDFRPGAA